MRGELNQVLDVLSGVISAGVIVRVILIFQNGRNEEKSMTEVCRKAGRVVYAGVIAVTIVSSSNWVSSAFYGLQGTGSVVDIGNVIIRLFKIVKNGLIFLTGSLTVWGFVKELLLYQFGNENSRPTHAQGAKKQVVIGIFILCTAALVTAVVNYY